MFSRPLVEYKGHPLDHEGDLRKPRLYPCTRSKEYKKELDP